MKTVVWGDKPDAAKVVEDVDVYPTRVHPGKGRHLGRGAGSFHYALEPDGPEVGRVGSGLTDALRKELWQNRDSLTGRVAKVHALRQNPSGALFGNRFRQWHPSKDPGAYSMPAKLSSFDNPLGTGKLKLNRFMQKRKRSEFGSLFGMKQKPKLGRIRGMLSQKTSADRDPELFKIGFLTRLAELGIRPSEMEKASASFLDWFKTMGRVGVLGGKLGVGLGLAVPFVGGTLAGAGARSAIQADDEDVDEIKQKEMTQVYRQLAKDVRERTERERSRQGF